jgi:hypothetical protein
MGDFSLWDFSNIAVMLMGNGLEGIMSMDWIDFKGWPAIWEPNFLTFSWKDWWFEWEDDSWTLNSNAASQSNVSMPPFSRVLLLLLLLLLWLLFLSSFTAPIRDKRAREGWSGGMVKVKLSLDDSVSVSATRSLLLLPPLRLVVLSIGVTERNGGSLSLLSLFWELEFSSEATVDADTLDFTALRGTTMGVPIGEEMGVVGKKAGETEDRLPSPLIRRFCPLFLDPAGVESSDWLFARLLVLARISMVRWAFSSASEMARSRGEGFSSSMRAIMQAMS